MLFLASSGTFDRTCALTSSSVTPIALPAVCLQGFSCKAMHLNEVGDKCDNLWVLCVERFASWLVLWQMMVDWHLLKGLVFCIGIVSCAMLVFLTEQQQINECVPCARRQNRACSPAPSGSWKFHEQPSEACIQQQIDKKTA